MNPWQRAWKSASAGGATAVVLAVFALAVCAPFAWRFARAWWMPAPSAFTAKDDTKDRAQQYAAAFDPFVKQLDGRSLFYEPSAPGSEGEVAVEPEEEIDPTQPAPTRYDGPTIQAVVLDTVWFSDGQRVKAGAGASGDMEVLSTNAPWDVRVKWRGTEFTVPFFERDKVIFKDAKGARASTPSTTIAATPAEPAPAAPAPPTPTEPTPEAPAPAPPTPPEPTENTPASPPAAAPQQPPPTESPR